MVLINMLRGLEALLEACLNSEDIIKMANRMVIEMEDFNHTGKNTTLQDLIRFQLKYIPPAREKGNNTTPPASIGLSPSTI